MAGNRKYNYVELFSGCGGMSLGLESAGFTRLLANEISPMAAETFAFNLVDGARKSGQSPHARKSGSWSDYFSFLAPPPEEADGSTDEKTYRDWRRHKTSEVEMRDDVKQVLTKGASPNLLVGDASKLADIIEMLKRRGGPSLWSGFKNVDLLAGGPPCQSFSLAGKRQKDHPRNKLFLSFVRIASALQPKVILFENVLGITRRFRGEDGSEWHPWHEVCRAFRDKGFIPIPSLVNAADFGVPQTRPRFIMVALRNDIAKKVEASGIDDALSSAVALGRASYSDASDDQSLIYRHDSDDQLDSWPMPLFPSPLEAASRVSVGAALEDLIGVGKGKRYHQGAFSKDLDTFLKRPKGIPVPKEIANHKFRKHGPRTTARFRLLRVLANNGFRAKSMAEVSARRDKAIELLEGKMLFLLDEVGGFSETQATGSAADVGALIDELSSAKHAQRCLDSKKPAPAQLSIPDDFIHWKEDRVLTIREMARIQSFPDWFVFRSKETTGGSSRAYEVPQYTQVGNAVPPLLARSFGDSIKAVLKRLETN